jgi:hypothetical protein
MLIPSRRPSALSIRYLLRVYIPSVALIASAAFYNKTLLPWAFSIALLLGGVAFSTKGEFCPILN